MSNKPGVVPRFAGSRNVCIWISKLLVEKYAPGKSPNLGCTMYCFFGAVLNENAKSNEVVEEGLDSHKLLNVKNFHNKFRSQLDLTTVLLYSVVLYMIFTISKAILIHIDTFCPTRW